MMIFVAMTLPRSENRLEGRTVEWIQRGMLLLVNYNYVLMKVGLRGF
jgi:hypothetical protein